MPDVEKCKYFLEFPAGINRMPLCTAYSYAKTQKGHLLMPCPECSEKNCPLRHPELLKGGTLPEIAL